MQNPSENELLSAYLDGELTAAEQAQVEQMLAGSPSARQLLDELRAIGSTLRSLPRQKLGENLSTRVLQDAVKQKLNGIDVPQPASQLPPSPSPSEQGHPRLRPFGRRIVERFKNNPRLVVWPIVIVTVAVLLMVFNPDQPGGNANRNIARVPADKNGGKNANNEDRAVGAKILEPKQGEIVNTDDQPSMRTLGSPEGAPKSSNLVTKGSPSGEKTLNRPSANARASLIVVQCQVSRESLKRQDYRKVFDANNVALSDKSAVETLRTTLSELAQATGIERAVLEDNPQVANTDPKSKVLAVEVTDAQFAGIIDGLKAVPETFRAFSMNLAQLPQPQPSTTAVPPPSAAKAPPMKRVLFVFRIADP